MISATVRAIKQAISAGTKTISSCANKPIAAIKAAKARTLFSIVRSRNFLLLAAITALPEVFAAVSATYKIVSPPTTVTLVWLLWAVAATSWIYAILRVYEKYVDYRSRKQKEF